MLELVGVSKRFALEKRQRKTLPKDHPRVDGKYWQALYDIDLKLERGRAVALVGANGAGKSTLLRLIATALRPDSGTITVDGHDAVAHPHDVRPLIGILTGASGLYRHLTVRENLRFFGQLYNLNGAALTDRIDALADQLALGEFLDRRSDGLSTGMHQRAVIARTLIHAPPLVILDEPTTGLDILSLDLVLEQIGQLKAAGTTLLFATHHIEEVDLLCDDAWLLQDGRATAFGSLQAMRDHFGAATTRAALSTCLRGVTA